MDSDGTAYGFVADAENISLCGQHRLVDLLGFVSYLRRYRKLDPRFAVVCNNHLNPMERTVLEGFGFRCPSARENCDELVKAEMLRMAEAGVRYLTLASGDGGYLPLVQELKARFGIRVHLIAARRCMSSRLRRIGDGITYLDQFFASRPVARPSLFARVQGAVA